MAKAIKLKNNTYLDSSGIVHDKNSLNDILKKLIGYKYYQADANNFNKTGVYLLSSGATNIPHEWSFLLVMSAENDADCVVQFAIPITVTGFYIRKYLNGNWSNWVQY